MRSRWWPMTAVIVALAGAEWRSSAVAAAPQAPARLVVITAGDDMKFSVTSIAAARGERIKIRLVAIGTQPKAAMAHNVVVLRPGTDRIAFTEAAAKAKDTDYIPAKLQSQILAATILIGGGESADVEFTLPDRAGVYPFLCSFPGHFANGARGTIEVK